MIQTYQGGHPAYPIQQYAQTTGESFKKPEWWDQNEKHYKEKQGEIAASNLSSTAHSLSKASAGGEIGNGGWQKHTSAKDGLSHAGATAVHLGLAEMHERRGDASNMEAALAHRKAADAHQILA